MGTRYVAFCAIMMALLALVAVWACTTAPVQAPWEVEILGPV